METVIYNTKLMVYMYYKGERKYLKNKRKELRLDKKEKFYVLTNLFSNDKMKKGKLFKHDNGEYTKFSFNSNDSVFVINAK